VQLEGLGKLKKKNKNKNPHQDLNPQPSGLEHSASTNYATACHALA
jgi:hypothetical protein